MTLPNERLPDPDQLQFTLSGISVRTPGAGSQAAGPGGREPELLSIGPNRAHPGRPAQGDSTLEPSKERLAGLQHEGGRLGAALRHAQQELRAGVGLLWASAPERERLTESKLTGPQPGKLSTRARRGGVLA
ncbi:MAG: hypothetical protein JKY65_06645 [Planctomycetes bacterium]|nr:hypothetical protein [Planctomycetota bacterium]